MATSRGVCVRVHLSVQLSGQRAATHLEVSVHNIMLVDMIDTLQDLTNAMTTEKEKGTDREGDVSYCSSSQKTKKKINPPHEGRKS